MDERRLVACSILFCNFKNNEEQIITLQYYCVFKLLYEWRIVILIYDFLLRYSSNKSILFIAES